jgi:Pyruvate/2-oxoacid:ferredoxin oxidoreductase delta subunit
MIRNIVRIDEEKCIGCGICTRACAEGAIQLVDGVAKLVSDSYCDGLGNCLGKCPVDAITIEAREAEAFDEKAVQARMTGTTAQQHGRKEYFTCPSTRTLEFSPSPTAGTSPAAETPSQLRHWPVQLHLVSPNATFLQNADLLITADCVPVAYGGFQTELLAGHVVVMGCPKLDDGQAYLDKLTTIVHQANLRSITVAHMEVPCCYGLVQLVKQAVMDAGSQVPVKLVEIGIRGENKNKATE